MSGKGSRFGGQGCGQGSELRSGVKVRVMIGGHKVWGQGRGSVSGVKVRGVSRSWGGGQCLADWGQMVDWGG